MRLMIVSSDQRHFVAAWVADGGNGEKGGARGSERGRGGGLGGVRGKGRGCRGLTPAYLCW